MDAPERRFAEEKSLWLEQAKAIERPNTGQADGDY
jgi:hypothetical protein